jgi:uncharacterized protein (DUF433 family)
MDLPEFLIDHPDGEVRIAGRRISLYDVISHHQNGDTVEGIAREFELDPKLVHQVLGFYASSRAEVDAYVARVRAEIERQETAYQPGPAHLGIQQRMQDLRQSEAS